MTDKYEIIGLSSDILKDEELAKKVVENKYPDIFKWLHVIRAVFDAHKIEGNQLIIKKHGN